MVDRTDPTFDDFADVETLLGELTADDRTLEAPPAGLWDTIAAEVGIDETLADDAPAHDAVADDREAEVVPLRRTPARPMLIVAAVAAAFLLVAGVVGASILGDDDTTEVVATAELVHEEGVFDPLGAESAATVVLIDEDGTFSVEFDTTELSEPSDEPADLELWLIEPDAEGAVADLVSLGTVATDGSGTHQVPEGIDPNTFLVVDISVEPRDGDDTHSGRSILRAPFEFSA